MKVSKLNIGSVIVIMICTACTIAPQKMASSIIKKSKLVTLETISTSGDKVLIIKFVDGIPVKKGVTKVTLSPGHHTVSLDVRKRINDGSDLGFDLYTNIFGTASYLDDPDPQRYMGTIEPVIVGCEFEPGQRYYFDISGIHFDKIAPSEEEKRTYKRMQNAGLINDNGPEDIYRMRGQAVLSVR